MEPASLSHNPKSTMPFSLLQLYRKKYVRNLKSKEGLPPATAKQRHRLLSFSPEQTNANALYSYKTEMLIDVTE